MDAINWPADGLHLPTAAELLDAWEQGLAQPAALRPLALLAAACPGAEPRSLARLSLGRRDAALLALRAALFGPSLPGVAPCPACGLRTEFSFQVADVSIPAPPGPGDELLDLAWEDYRVRFRLPNSLDLASLEAGQGDGGQALLDRCLVGAVRHGPAPARVTREAQAGDDAAIETVGEVALQVSDEAVGENVRLADLPQGAITAVEAAMAAADPQADVQLALTCPACGHEWQAPFDIAVYLWAEVDAWAHHILYDVHLLALAYGWREADVLVLSPARRQAYIEMVQA